MTEPGGVAAPPAGSPDIPSSTPASTTAGPESTGPAATARRERRSPVDLVAIAVAGVFAVLAAVKVLPAIPWDSINIPAFRW